MKDEDEIEINVPKEELLKDPELHLEYLRDDFDNELLTLEEKEIILIMVKDLLRDCLGDFMGEPSIRLEKAFHSIMKMYMYFYEKEVNE